MDPFILMKKDFLIFRLIAHMMILAQIGHLSQQKAKPSSTQAMMIRVQILQLWALLDLNQRPTD